MKFIILATLCSSVTCVLSGKDEADRREGISYSTNVVHTDPNFPDQQAQSSIDFKIETPDFGLKSTVQPAGGGGGGGYYSFSTATSIPDYQHDYSGHNWAQTQNYPIQKKPPTPRPTQSSFRYNQPQIPKGMYPQIYSHPQYTTQAKPAPSFPTSSQSQSFNVGYSVKFGGDRGKPFKAPRLETDVITGSRKEEVKKPISIENYNYNALLDTKKQKITGIKPKFSKPLANPNTNHVITQSHITPKTQKQLAYLETIQGVNKFQKDIEQNIQAVQGSVNSPWQSLSPSVEIYRSREVNFAQENPGYFDHQKALGKSEGFDYTNAVDFSALSASNIRQFVQPEVYDKQTNKPVSFHRNQYNPSSQLYSYANQQGAANTQQSALVGNVKPTIPKLPVDTSLLRDPVLTVENQAITPDSNKIPIHFDTSLIKDIGKSYGAVYNEVQGNTGGYGVNNYNQNHYEDSEGKESKSYKLNDSSEESSKVVQSYEQTLNDQEVIPHQTNLQHISHLIEQSKNLGASENSYAESQSTFNSKPNPYESGYNPKSNRFESSGNSDIKFAFPQNGLFNPSVHKMPSASKFPPKKSDPFKGEYYRLRKPNMYMVKEPSEEIIQPPPAQFKVFSKPANGFMRHEYEKFQKIRNSEKPITPRQPRINPKRIIRDYSLETDLKPPPMRYSRPRRMHKYETRL